MQNLSSTPFQFRSYVSYKAADNCITMEAGDRRLNTKGLSVRTHHSHPKVQFVLIHSERKLIPKVVANFLPFDCP